MHLLSKCGQTRLRLINCAVCWRSGQSRYATLKNLLHVSYSFETSSSNPAWSRMTQVIKNHRSNFGMKLEALGDWRWLLTEQPRYSDKSTH
eukprot:1144479-Amphidinium_carterae.1